jgi:hypothetical protein
MEFMGVFFYKRNEVMVCFISADSDSGSDAKNQKQRQGVEKMVQKKP